MTAILVTRDELFRRQLQQRLLEAGCEDVRVAGPPEQFAPLLDELRHAVIVVGGEWPKVRALLRMAVRVQAPAILVLQQQAAALPPAGAAPDENAREALDIGARGVVHADISASALKAAVAACHAGLIVLDSAFAGPRDSLNPDQVRRERPTRQLTTRERKILSFIAAGVSNKGIARNLGVSVNTVKFHLAAAFEKLKAATRAEAVAEAIRRGELSL